MYLVQIHFQSTKVIYFYPFKSWIFCSNISFALTLTLSVSYPIFLTVNHQESPTTSLLRFTRDVFQDAFFMEFTTYLVPVNASHASMWWSKVNLWEPTLSFHHGHFGVWIQVVKLDYKFFYLLSHLTSSGTQFEEGLQNSLIYVYIHTLTLCQSLLLTFNSSKQNEVFVFMNFTDKKISSSNLTYRITAVINSEYKKWMSLLGSGDPHL